MSRFVQVDRETAYLLPPSAQDGLPEGHRARIEEAKPPDRVERAQAQFAAKQAERERRQNEARRPPGPPPEPFGSAPQDPLAAMAHRLRNRDGRALYALRKSTGKPVQPVGSAITKRDDPCIHTERSWPQVRQAAGVE